MTPILGADVTLVHCSDFSDADLDAVAGSGARIVLTPSSEMASGLQPLQIQKLVDRGIRPGWGSTRNGWPRATSLPRCGRRYPSNTRPSST